MTLDALGCPWSRTPLPGLAAPVPVSFAVLAAPVGTPALASAGDGDPLACPWTGTALPPVTARPVTGLPSLAPTLPAPRAGAAAAPAAPAQV